MLFAGDVVVAEHFGAILVMPLFLLWVFSMWYWTGDVTEVGAMSLH